MNEQQAPASEQNPYYRPNSSLQMAEAKQAQAMADKARAEQAVLQQQAQMQGLGNPVQAGPTVQPQEVQAQQLAEGLVRGQLGQAQLGAMIQAGELDPMVAEAAMGMAQQYMQQDQARNEQAMGLGAF